MIKNILFGLIIAGVIFSFSIPMVVLAQEDYEVPDLNKNQIFEMIEKIADWMFTILLITSVFVILISAFQFVTGGDNPENLTKARQKLIWAVVGIGLAVAAKGIPTVIISVLNP
ncbi:MAG: pilin [Patescibacteria group bacterium]|nr:pilin [Patescibacteria group bacterium]